MGRSLLRARAAGDRDAIDCGSALSQAHVRFIRRLGGATLGGEPVLACATNIGRDADGTVLMMGVWPPGVGLQGQAPNPLMLRRLRGAVVSDEEKAANKAVR